MERLGDVIVSAEVETLGLVGGRALGSQQDHGDGTSLAELAHDFDAVEVGHDDVEEDDVGPNLFGLQQCLFAAVGGDDAEPLLAECDRDELGDPRFVIGDEDQRLGAHALPPLRTFMVTDDAPDVIRRVIVVVQRITKEPAPPVLQPELRCSRPD